MIETRIDGREVVLQWNLDRGDLRCEFIRPNLTTVHFWSPVLGFGEDRGAFAWLGMRDFVRVQMHAATAYLDLTKKQEGAE